MPDLPRFPNPADVIAEEADAWRRLSVDEKLNRMAEMFEKARLDVENSPNREAILAQVEADHEALRQFLKNMFTRFRQKSHEYPLLEPDCDMPLIVDV